MKREEPVRDVLSALDREKGQICVSIIVPVHRLSPARRGDERVLKNTMDKAGQLIRDKYGEEMQATLVAGMEELYGNIDFNHNQDGIGLYLSPRIKRVVHFPFAVKEKVVVGERFETRDLLYWLNFAVPYYVLALSEKMLRLYEGRWNDLSEVKDEFFPIKHEEAFEYAKPVRSSSFAGHSHVKMYEKDKPELEKIRLSGFFRDADKKLAPYLEQDRPLVLAGADRDLSLFSGLTSHEKNLAGKIRGNVSHTGEKELAGQAWPLVFTQLRNNHRMLIKDFEEKIGENRGISGIGEIWKAAVEGRAFKLLVEKDYSCPGFIAGDDKRLYRRPPKKPHTILPDAVDTLIGMVLEKNGQVFFTDNDLLKDYGKTALITRY